MITNETTIHQQNQQNVGRRRPSSMSNEKFYNEL